MTVIATIIGVWFAAAGLVAAGMCAAARWLKPRPADTDRDWIDATPCDCWSQAHIDAEFTKLTSGIR